MRKILLKITDMRRTNLLLLLSLLAYQLCLAAPRSYKQAKAIALRNAEKLGISTTDATLGKQAPGSPTEADGKAYYVFNNGNENGFTIVAGDDLMPEILGYATRGSLTDDNMPLQLKALLDAYESKIEAMANGDKAAADAAAERRGLSDTKVANIAVAPLLGEIAWDQLEPFNLLCPTVGGKKCVTGCVATAMAQIMDYYNYHTYLENDIPAFTTRTHKISMPSISAGEKYDYENMLTKYSSDYSPEQGEAVAKLMLHCGSSVTMDYTIGGSGAATNQARYAFTDYFGYDTDLIANVNRLSYSLEEWCSIIDTELGSNRPILYSGDDAQAGGHAFICDGADGNGLYHINWGWGGYSNGYFDISLLNDSNAGNTDGADGYNSNCSMIIGIAPDNGVEDTPTAQDEPLIGQIISASLTKSVRTDGADTFEGHASIKIANMSPERFEGWVALAIETDEGTQLISNTQKFDLPGMEGNMFYLSSPTYSFKAALPEGTTKVFIVYGQDEDGYICGSYENKPYFFIDATATTAKISSGTSLSAELTTDGEIYSGTSNEFTLTVNNTGIDDFCDYVYVLKSSTDVMPDKAISKIMLTVPAQGSTTRKINIKPTEAGQMYVWVVDENRNALIDGQAFSVESSSTPVLTLVSVETNAEVGEYEMEKAYIYNGSDLVHVRAPKTYDAEANFTFKISNTGGSTSRRFQIVCYCLDGKGSNKISYETLQLKAGTTESVTFTTTYEEMGSRFLRASIALVDEGDGVGFYLDSSLEQPRLYKIDNGGNVTNYYYYFSTNNGIVYLAETSAAVEAVKTEGGIEGGKGCIRVTLDETKSIDIVGIGGQKLKTVNATAGQTLAIPLAPGLYVVNGKKVAVQ